MAFFPTVRILIALTIASLVGVSAALVNETRTNSEVLMWVEPNNGVVTVDDTFSIYVQLTSQVPVNVFKGHLVFDPAYLEVTRIDYNSSIANLWAEEPWYSNGDGTLNYIGGTTKSGGFIGDGTLVTVTFKAKKTGRAILSLRDSQVLKHDGLGSDAELGTPLDAIFTVTPEQIASETVFNESLSDNEFSIVDKPPDLDLNGDGKQSMFDISIFMTHLASRNLRSDFNQDGKVNLRDFSILTQ